MHTVQKREVSLSIHLLPEATITTLYICFQRDPIPCEYRNMYLQVFVYINVCMSVYLCIITSSVIIYSRREIVIRRSWGKGTASLVNMPCTVG